MELVARKPEQHMRCFGVRWCRMCGDAAPVGKRCLPCRRMQEAVSYARRMLDPNRRLLLRHHRARYMRRRLSDPMHRHVHNQQSARWDRNQRKLQSPYYAKQKALKRVKYWACRVAALLSVAA